MFFWRRRIMSKKDKEEKFRDLWKQFLKEGIKDPKDIEKEMIKETKEKLLKLQLEVMKNYEKLLVSRIANLEDIIKKEE